MENQLSPLTFPEKSTTSSFSDIRAGHVAIRTTRYDDMIKWYQDILEFRLLREWTAGDMQLGFIAPPNDNNFIIEILGIKKTDHTYSSEVRTGYDHLCFNVEDLDKTIEELKKRNVDITRSFNVPAIGKRVAFIEDPFGNSIEFCDDLKI